MLTERRKADRAKMAKVLQSIAIELGATATIKPAPLSRSGLWVEIEAPRGLCLTVSLKSDSPQPDTHVLGWHMSSDVDTCFGDEFWHVASLNPYHWRKATSVVDGFDALCDVVRRGLTLASTGQAFSAEREAAAIAKAGMTAAQRNARYDAWRSAPATV